MELGCGLEVKRIKGRRYLYFWSYRRENGRSKRNWKYIGPIGKAESRRKALKTMIVHHEAVLAEANRKLAAMRSKLHGV